MYVNIVKSLPYTIIGTGKDNFRKKLREEEKFLESRLSMEQ